MTSKELYTIIEFMQKDDPNGDWHELLADYNANIVGIESVYEALLSALDEWVSQLSCEDKDANDLKAIEYRNMVLAALIKWREDNKVEKYTLVNYFDVWGNAEEGWEVNNLCNEGIIELKDGTTEEIIRKLKEFGFLVNDVTEDMLYIWNDYDMIELFEEDNQRPICRLERIQD